MAPISPTAILSIAKDAYNVGECETYGYAMSKKSIRIISSDIAEELASNIFCFPKQYPLHKPEMVTNGNKGIIDNNTGV